MIKLSIITINYNDAAGLKETLDSVAAQTYPHIEHIIVDGGSTDGSVEVIEAYASGVACTASGCGIKDAVSAADAAVNSQPAKGAQLREATQPANGTLPAHSVQHQILWVSEPDKGIYNAMNKGIEIALGKRIVNDDHTSSPLASRLSPDSLSEYIQILNSGDMLADADVTKNMISQLTQSHESIGILYGNMIKAYPNGKRVKDTCLGDSKSKKENLFIRETQWTMYDFIKGTINHDPTYIHRDLYEKYGLYDDTLKIVSDWKWFVNAVVLGAEKVFYIPMNVTIFDMTGISETNLEAREIERHRELEKILPAAILADYDTFHFPINQYKRLKRHGLWRLVYFIERVLFKLEKWHILSK